MRPQHFQQYDRYWETFVDQRLAGVGDHAWGLRSMVIDANMLALGTIQVSSLSAILPDGTPIDAPEEADPPPPRQPGPEGAGRIVSLALVGRHADEPELDIEAWRSAGGAEGAAATPPTARVAISVQAVRDASTRGGDAVDVQVARPACKLVFNDEPTDGLITLPLARIRAIGADGSIELDDAFLPPAVTCAAHPWFGAFVSEIEALLRRRAETLAGEVDPSRSEGLSDLLDFLLLQTVNREEARFAHLKALPNVHPERVYTDAVSLAGELSTFSTERRPPRFPAYDHRAPHLCFPPVLDVIRRSISVVSERPALQLPMEERKYGIHISMIGDRTLLRSAQFVLIVRAEVPAEQLIQTIPNQIKVGPVEEIRNLVSLQLSGIGLSPLPVTPRAISYYSGAAYFDLSRQSDLWSKLEGSVAFAFHVAGEYPGLKLEFWAIRDN